MTSIEDQQKIGWLNFFAEIFKGHVEVFEGRVFQNGDIFVFKCIFAFQYLL